MPVPHDDAAATHDTPTLDDVMETTEEAVPDHREHAKAPKHLDDDELQRRTEQERVEGGLDDYASSEIPPAS